MANLKITWHIDHDSYPLKAEFAWKRDGKTIQNASFTIDELNAEIQKLEDKGMKAPREFMDAFVDLKRKS